MMAEKTEIDDKQIIALYQSGFSQNDIAGIYKVSLARTRAVLKGASFDTRGYRALNEWQKRIIVTLVRAGVRYLDVERVTDIAFHALRDYICRIPPMADRGKLSSSHSILDEHGRPCVDALIREFRSGTSFSKLAAHHDLRDSQILYFYQKISEDDLVAHSKALREQILRDLDSGLSVSIIARKYWISRAIVKRYSNH